MPSGHVFFEEISEIPPSFRRIITPLGPLRRARKMRIFYARLSTSRVFFLREKNRRYRLSFSLSLSLFLPLDNLFFPPSLQ